MTDDDVIGLLNHDMGMEHQAIVQYLLAAWRLGGSVGGSIESIARDEMRHFKYFALAVRSLGGKPNMSRPAVDVKASPTEIIEANASAEDEAVEVYTEHMEAISHPEIKKLYERIIGDEKYHGEKFRRMLPKVEGLEATAPREPETEKEKLLQSYLQADISGEYAAILRYLHQSFVVDDGWLASSLEDRSIDEMKHMAWMAEEAIEAGGQPNIEPDPVEHSEDIREIFEGNLKLERGAEERYQKHIEGYDDEDMRRLWRHIQIQEEHHSDEFENRLSDLVEREAPGDTTAGERPEEAEPAESATEAEAKELSRQRRSVGSLFGKKQK